MNTRKGFTLVELLVVIAILAILATVSVVGYTSFISQADKTALDTDAANIEKVIEADLVIDGVCEIGKVGDKVVTAKREGTSIVIYVGADKVAADTAIDSFTHTELTQFDGDKYAHYTFKVGANGVITVTSSKLSGNDATVTIELD